MDVGFLNAFVQSICNTFETMCDLKVQVGKPNLGEDTNGDVSAVIGFSGDAAGSVIIEFDFETASKVATAFAKTEINPDHPDFADALGELANMVAGGAKAKFDGISVDISLPSVVIGQHHRFPTSRNVKRLLLPCSTEAGAFSVHVGMVVSKVTPQPAQPQTAGAQA
ncbi:MAG: chemotaxis protein CheX [Phycisphaerae bacterium]